MSTYGSNFTPKDTPRVDFVKDRLMIVIFGSYDEDTDALERLVGFKEFLQSIGYTGTRLVRDIEEPKQEEGEDMDEYLWRKCKHWMEKCDVALFVFFKEGRLEGMTMEFGEFVNKLSHRMDRAIAFTEKFPISKMIKGKIKELTSQLKETDFDDDDDLNEKAQGLMIDFPKKYYHDIKDRNPFPII